MDKELLKKNFENHGFRTSFFETKEEAAAYLAEKIKNTSVAFGGSMTAEEMKLDEALKKENQIIWHWRGDAREALCQARTADTYISSVNGVSETGELVNIDGTGNRVAQTLYGSKQVYFVVGRNKLTKDLQSAIYRAKNIAAPKNALRIGVKTPCVANGGDRCYDCSSPERICRATVILERPCKGMEAEVVFINEELGY